MPIPISPFLSKGFEELAKAGITEGARHAVPWLQQVVGERILDYATQIASGLLAMKFEEILKDVAPDIDEIPNEILERFSQSELAALGKQTLHNLGDDAKQAVKKAGLSTSQLGAAVLMSLANLQQESQQRETE